MLLHIESILVNVPGRNALKLYTHARFPRRIVDNDPKAFDVVMNSVFLYTNMPIHDRALDLFRPNTAIMVLRKNAIVGSLRSQNR